MFIEIIKAFLLIFVAEMGDKTQILAMAFATRYPVKKVLAGIALGVLINHSIAVILGSYLSRLIPINTLSMIAGVAFIGFSLWTLKSEESEEENETGKIKFGPILTVSLAFFLGELGDKTQLSAITLSASSNYPFFILIGTVTGMIATGAIGIFIGKKLGDKIPELTIKLMAATIFMFFGLQKLLVTLPKDILKPAYVIPVLIILIIIVSLMLRKLLRDRKNGIESDLVLKSKLLYDYYHHIKTDLDNICMGKEYCKVCSGSACAIGHAKQIVNDAILKKEVEDINEITKVTHDKPFDTKDVIDSLVDTLVLLNTIEDKDKLQNADLIRQKLEIVLFKEAILELNEIDEYINILKLRDEKIAKEVEEAYYSRNTKAIV